jgi:gluconokinase
VIAEELALGVDLGTGSARAFLFDAAGRRQGGARYGYHWRAAVDGTVEADADQIVHLVFRAMDAALAELRPGAHVRAVGFSALWHTLLGVDAGGRPATPVFAWSDTRSTSAAAALRARLDAAAVHARTGAMLHPSYPPARLCWLRERDRGLFAAVSRWMSLPEYLWLRLTGEYAADLSIAAGSGLLDQGRLEWDAELMDVCGIGAGQLGRVAAGHDEASRAGADVPGAAAWPSLREALWRMPIGDGACANIGSGCHDATRAALSVGTSAALRVLLATGYSPPPAGLWAYRLDRERTLLGGAISNGGIVRSWLRALLRLPDDDAELDALLEARPPAAHGLAVLPFLAGERSPDWPLHATAAVAGMGVATSALDLLQAGMEAVAYRLLIVRRRLREAAPEATAVVASGGALRESPLWAQLIADVLGETLLVTADAETSSRGAALLALEAAGMSDAVAAAAPPMSTLLPDWQRHRQHAQALARHRELDALLG